MKPKAASSGSMAEFRQEVGEEERASKLPCFKKKRDGNSERRGLGQEIPSCSLTWKLSTSMLLVRPIELWKARDLIAT